MVLIALLGLEGVNEDAGHRHPLMLAIAIAMNITAMQILLSWDTALVGPAVQKRKAKGHVRA